MNEEEKPVGMTILNPGMAKPIAVSKEQAVQVAHEQESAQQEVEEVKPQTNFAEIQQVTKEELDEQKVNEVNDLMKNDYVKLKDVKYSKKTIMIMILVLAAIVGIVVLEVFIFGGKS